MVNIPDRIKKVIESYISDIRNICPIDKIILYGSYVSGSPKDESDIDLAIFSKAINESNRLRFTTLFLMKIAKYQLDIQPQAFPLEDYLDEENDFIAHEVKRKGMEIYSRS